MAGHPRFTACCTTDRQQVGESGAWHEAGGWPVVVRSLTVCQSKPAPAAAVQLIG